MSLNRSSVTIRRKAFENSAMTNRFLILGSLAQVYHRILTSRALGNTLSTISTVAVLTGASSLSWTMLLCPLGHFRQYSPAIHGQTTSWTPKLQRRRGRRVAFRTGAGIARTLDRR